MWDIFKDWIFDIIQFFYNFCHDWGLAIIIVTIIFRIIVAPLMHKQAKSNYAMQKVQPKIQALKDRFPDDPTRQSQEMQKIYAEMKFNPLALARSRTRSTTWCRISSRRPPRLSARDSEHLFPISFS